MTIQLDTEDGRANPALPGLPYDQDKKRRVDASTAFTFLLINIFVLNIINQNTQTLLLPISFTTQQRQQQQRQQMQETPPQNVSAALLGLLALVLFFALIRRKGTATAEHEREKTQQPDVQLHMCAFHCTCRDKHGQQNKHKQQKKAALAAEGSARGTQALESDPLITLQPHNHLSPRAHGVAPVAPNAPVALLPGVKPSTGLTSLEGQRPTAMLTMIKEAMEGKACVPPSWGKKKAWSLS
ncbi:uncharacterized protein IWZ02DRAFT_517212 [Phyllosticta citriasiana]|uniref:uncharacterized protein n=1 Tax=Phyllosticta citriasiana TaxID=595635 RepID=UPI0030FDA6CC